MDLPAHTRDRIAELRAIHKPTRIRVPGRWLKVDGCLLCRQPYPCRQINWCDDVESGRIEPAGWRP